MGNPWSQTESITIAPPKSPTKEELTAEFYANPQKYIGKRVLRVLIQKYRSKIDHETTDHEISKWSNQMLADVSPNSALKEKNKAPIIVDRPLAGKIQTKPAPTIKILVLGACGAGKTSLINIFYAWSQGIQSVSDLTSTLITTKCYKGRYEEEGADVNIQSKSQTKQVILYQFLVSSNGREYLVHFYDTPGLADPEGIDKDDSILELIIESLQNIPSLKTVLLVMNGSQERLSFSMEYVISRLKNTILDKTRNNTCLLLTNSTLSAKLDPAIYGIDVPKERIFFLDNILFLENIAALKPNQVTQVQEAYCHIKLTLAKVLETILKLEDLDCSIFKELALKKSEIRLKFYKLVGILESEQRMLSELRDIDKHLIETYNSIEALQSKGGQKETIKVLKLVETNGFHVICLGCQKTCHSDCNDASISQEDDVTFCCKLFSNQNSCKVCGCRPEMHQRNRKTFQETTQSKLIVSPDTIRILLDKQENLSKEKQTKGDSIYLLRQKQEKVKAEIFKIDFDLEKELLFHVDQLDKRISQQIEKNPTNSAISTQNGGEVEILKHIKKHLQELLYPMQKIDTTQFFEPLPQDFKEISTKKNQYPAKYYPSYQH